MARGGYRPGAGRPKGAAKTSQSAEAANSGAEDDVAVSTDTPLDYMLKVMRDSSADPVRRDRMAIAAAPFVHARKEPVGQGKREAEKDAAKNVGGRFAAGSPPKLAAAGGKRL